MPRIVFRCDASRRIGSGHVARCMALGHALLERGAQVELVARGLPQRVRDLLLKPAGVVVHDLPQPTAAQCLADEGPRLAHADWLTVSQATDALQCAELLSKGDRASWLIVDHYALDARWERALAKLADQVLVIDDLADRAHACDALLDQNFFLDAERRYADRVPAHAELMLGPKFALLRDEFARAREQLGQREGKLDRIFVCFGGFDAANQTPRAIEAIASAALGNEVDVIIGSDHKERQRIGALCAAQRGYRVHLDSENVASLMASADLAIGASGIMNWERAALRLPAIITSSAENQQIVARDLADERACIYLGAAAEWQADTLAAWLRALAGTPSLMRALASRTGELTDGRGARRVAMRLLPQRIVLRPATQADCLATHAWRNAEETRLHSNDPAPIPLEAHRQWFQRVLTTSGVALLIGEDAEGAVGVLRYDIEGEGALVSVYLVPGRHGRGLGTALLRAGTAWIRQHHTHVTQLKAQIRDDNVASREAFANAGYRMDSFLYTLGVKHG